MPQIRVSLSFAKAADHEVEGRAGSVSEQLYGNPAFTNPPVTQTVLQTALTDFTKAIAARGQGGTAATALKNEKREDLLTHLRALGLYVQTASANNMATLLSSGFEAVNANRASTQLDKPGIVGFDVSISGQIVVRGTPVRNARNYELRYSLVPSQWSPSIIISQARRMIVKDLDPGKLYTFQIRALGGSTGYSDWSDPVSHRCM